MRPDHRHVSVLFSEPKIPQLRTRTANRAVSGTFQCSSASRKFLNLPSSKTAAARSMVSVLFSEPKIPQLCLFVRREPGFGRAFQCSSASRKFLNSIIRARASPTSRRFSALQRAENSSTTLYCLVHCLLNIVSVLFSEPKIPQQNRARKARNSRRRFSALQRAENSSTTRANQINVGYQRFQCSSASRKFLNRSWDVDQKNFCEVSVLFSEPKIPQLTILQNCGRAFHGFSALQRAENSSTQHQQTSVKCSISVSVLFSEPKIPQPVCRLRSDREEDEVSVLFSEPKIPQPVTIAGSSIAIFPFQCSSASRKFLNRAGRAEQGHTITVSVLFSEPKIPQPGSDSQNLTRPFRFSALQRAENSSTISASSRPRAHAAVSVLFSEPKIPQRSAARSSSVATRRFSALQRAENSSTLRAR